MRTSQNGINLSKKFEGCRLETYRCPAGKPTIGYGHTAGVKMGQKITQVQAESFLKGDLAKYEKLVEKYDSRYHWNQNQFDALVSFAYNIGSIDQLTENGKRSVQEVSAAIPKYNTAKVNGVKKVLAGLTERRKAEQALFLQPVREQKPIQAASVETEHMQLNYKPGKQYRITASGLRIRTKRAGQSPTVLPNGGILGTAKQGGTVKNLATARVGDQIWMYIGLDKLGREQWICADTGGEAYVN